MFCPDVKASAALRICSGRNDLGGGKLRGLNMKKYLQPRKFAPCEVVYME
jgi:hypothetical protein